MSIATLAFMAALAAAGQSQPAPSTPCAVDREAMMALGIDAFDQDMNGGWRPLAQRAECQDVAADLIRDYRAFIVDRTRLLYWHEGQLRAGLGQTAAAIGLFEQARRPDSDEFGWNHYVDATIAFLRGDRPALLAARTRLAAMRPPPNRTEPMNLGVVDGFVHCFGQPYREAYGTACREARNTD